MRRKVTFLHTELHWFPITKHFLKLGPFRSTQVILRHQLISAFIWQKKEKFYAATLKHLLCTVTQQVHASETSRNGFVESNKLVDRLGQLDSHLSDTDRVSAFVSSFGLGQDQV